MKKNKLKLIDKVKPGKIAKRDISALEETLGDRELVLFFLSYLKHDRNASRAYKYLHPECTDQSCRVLGSRQLAKVNIQVIMDSYGLGVEKYLSQLKSGIDASTKREVCTGADDFGPVYSTIEEPDHKTRRHYHQALGELLGIEGKPGVAIQVNNNNTNTNIIDNLQDDELDDLIS